jgi:saccharopine dehydrogenase-like NADP-dependent oxidoreductase
VDLVVEALPGALALQAAEASVDAGAHFVSSMYLLSPEQTDGAEIDRTRRRIEDLNGRARSAGLTVLPEFGLDPGIDLVLASAALRAFDSVERFRSYGAGLPAGPAGRNPLRYRFSWTPIGVMRSYNRPAVVIREGDDICIPAERIFAPENVHELEVPGFDEPLECFANGNSAVYAEMLGLRDSVREFGRFACRYPGHCRFWHAAATAGFLRDSPIDAGVGSVSPQAFTAALLAGQDQFRYGEADSDLTLLRLEVEGKKNGRDRRVAFQMLDRRDMKSGLTSMQRTVGFMLGLGARLILGGAAGRPGILHPTDMALEPVERGLAAHGITINRVESDP